MHKKDRSANGRSIVFIAFAAVAILIMTSSVLIAVQNTDGEPVGNGIVVDGLRYDIHGDGTATSTGLDDSYASASLTIPDTIEYNGKEYKVTAVGEKAFYYCECLLGSLVIGKNVETIGNLAFNHCGFLGTLTFKGDNLRSIGFGAFDSCRFAGDLTIPSKVTSIGSLAFKYCYFGGTLTLGTNIQKIEWDAFSSCGFKNIFIGSGNVEYHAFGYCENMKKITIAKGVSLSPDAFTCDFCNENHSVINVDEIPGYVYTYEYFGRPIMVRQSAIYTVFLDDGFGKKLPPIVGTGTTELPIIEHPPLEFGGWFDGEKVYAPGEDYNITKNITLFAIWGSSSGSVNVMSFNLNGGTDNGTGAFDAIKIAAGETYNLPSAVPDRTGYIFGGWECN